MGRYLNKGVVGTVSAVLFSAVGNGLLTHSPWANKVPPGMATLILASLGAAVGVALVRMVELPAESVADYADTPTDTE